MPTYAIIIKINGALGKDFDAPLYLESYHNDLGPISTTNKELAHKFKFTREANSFQEAKKHAKLTQKILENYYHFDCNLMIYKGT